MLLWPHSIWLRVRVAQCSMALHVMVQSHLGWPWECHKSPDTSFGSILDEYALRDGWHPSCYCLLRHTLLRMAGHDAIHLAKHTHPEWRKRGHHGTESIPKAILAVTAFAKPWHASAHALGPKKICGKKLFTG